MISVYWSPEPSQHRLKVSRHFTVLGGFSLQVRTKKRLLQRLLFVCVWFLMGNEHFVKTGLGQSVRPMK